jgi:hypothetical protein
MGNPTQVERVAAVLRANGEINPLFAIRHISVLRLAARISDLKKKGWDIRTDELKGINQYGEPYSVANYVLVSEPFRLESE